MSGEVKDKSAEIKALLIAEGGVDIDERILGRITTPASGPGAGLTSFFLRFDGHRVRLGIKHDSRLKASLDGDEIVIHDQEKEIVRGYLEDAIAHCPGQVFITVSEVCIFNCQYCPVPLLSLIHISEPTRLLSISYAVFCLKKKKSHLTKAGGAIRSPYAEVTGRGGGPGRGSE